MKTISLIIAFAAILAGCSTPAVKPSTDFAAFETPSENDTTVSAGHKRNALIESTWARGCGKGVKVYLPTDTWADGVARSTAWRLCEFDENGCLQKIHAQTIRTETMSMDQFGAISAPKSKSK